MPYTNIYKTAPYKNYLSSYMKAYEKKDTQKALQIRYRFYRDKAIPVKTKDYYWEQLVTNSISKITDRRLRQL